MFLFSLGTENILDKLGEAINQAGGYKDPGKVWYYLGLALRSTGLYQEASSAFERAIEYEPGSPTAKQSALHLARLAIINRNFAQAEDILNWFKNKIQTTKEKLMWVNVWTGLLVQKERVKEGWKDLANTIRKLRQENVPESFPHNWAYALVSYAGASILLDKTQEAEEALREALQIFEKIAPTGERHRDRGLTIVSINLGELYRLKGEVEKSREILQKALDLAQKHGFQDFLADARMNLAHTLAEAGKDLDLAEELLIEAEAFYRRQEHHADLVETRWIRAKILWQRGKKKEALKLAQEALQKAVEYALRAKEAAIAETLYHWTGKVSFKLQAAEAYQKIGNEARAQALKGD